MAVYVLCPDHNQPSGGVKKLYRHVDVLNKNGWAASIIHQTPGFRCTWFDNDTRISYAAETQLEVSDYLVLPEIYGPIIGNIQPGIRKVIFNQGCYLTFFGYSLAKKDDEAPYRHADVRAVLVVSEDSQEYLQYVFPGVRIWRLHYGLDPKVFAYFPQKKPQIAFMPRRNREDIRQVINALNYRGALHDVTLAPIEGQSERQTAEVLKESLIFLSFSQAEGFGLPPAEAMACGCIVIGFHGMGGREFFQPEHCYPVAQGDIISLVRTVEHVLDIARHTPQLLTEQGRKAAAFVAEQYSLQREESDIVSFWREMFAHG